MSLSVRLPKLIDNALYQVLNSILKRAVDGTRKPLQVDEVNQRVLVGTDAASASNNGPLEVGGGDIRIQDAGDGLVLVSANGTIYRLTATNDGAVDLTPL